MEHSPSKRRRISPTTTVPAKASNAHNAHLMRNGSNTSARRSSYLSPTKSSLARFNPNLLPRFRSVEPQRPAGKGTQAVPRRARTAEYISSTENGAAEQQEEDSATQDGQMAGLRRAVKEGDASPDVQDTPSKLPRSTVAGKSRDLGDAVQRTPTLDRMRHEVDEEPSLPSTPSQLGLEPPLEKPRGLLFQSPRRTPARKQTSEARISPLQPPNSELQATAALQEIDVPALGARGYINGVPKPASEALKGLTDPEPRLKHLEARIQALQDELTIGSIQFEWRKDDEGMKRRLARQRRDVGKDSRELCRGWDQSQHLRPPTEASTLEESPINLEAGISTITSRIAQFCPFAPRRSPKTTKSTTGPAPPTTGSADDTSPTVSIQNPSVIRTGNEGKPLVRQEIDITNPDSIQLVRLLLTIDPASQTISNVIVLSTAPGLTSELRPWLSQPSGEKTPAIIGHAIKRYIECDSLRAQCWLECSLRNPQLMVETAALGSSSVAVDAHRGRQSIQLARSAVGFEVRWLIAVREEDGGVESRVSCQFSCPNEWKGVDPGGDLAGVERAFEGLVREVGVTEALRIMARVLFSR